MARKKFGPLSILRSLIKKQRHLATGVCVIILLEKVDVAYPIRSLFFYVGFSATSNIKEVCHGCANDKFGGCGSIQSLFKKL
ncbi:hypothetical protein EUGRSUZ_E02202 [Eucalyptus grandis]|uniref:Uncharacterized protein n=2 Tax=Eucalyptus grandis TaxID=71139 RepID=A0ACC3KY47_EUCGR|nr:hypothetical protein EUGRSUZ_E02202 [Eucalyptus grandis]